MVILLDRYYLVRKGTNIRIISKDNIPVEVDEEHKYDILEEFKYNFPKFNLILMCKEDYYNKYLNIRDDEDE